MKTQKFSSMVVAKEMKFNKDGLPYGVITVMDGTNPLNLITKDNEVFHSVELYKIHDIVLDITLGKYTKVSIDSIEVA